MSNLVACKACKKEIAKSAKTCPHCGVSSPGVNIGKGCLGIIVFGALIGLIAGFFADKDTLTTPPDNQSTLPSISTPAVVNKIDFSISIDEYIKRYNQSLKALGRSGALYKKTEQDNGSNLITQTGLEDGSLGALLTGNNKTKALQSVFFIATGDGTTAGSINVMMGLAATVMAIENPYMTANERGTILKDLGISDEKIFEQPEVNGTRKLIVYRNGVNYTLSVSKQTGFWLVAEPTDKYQGYKEQLIKSKQMEDEFFNQ